VAGIVASLLLCGRHDADDAGTHIIGIMLLLLLRSQTQCDAMGHVPTSSASLLLCGRHDTDNAGLCAHIIGVMLSLSLHGQT